MPLKYLEESGFAAGMVRDVPSWMLPKGAVYDSLNMVYDQSGIARMRMGSTALSSPTTTANIGPLGFCYSQDGTPIEELYAFQGSTALQVVNVNKTTGAAALVKALVGTTSATGGRPVRHFGWVFFPYIDSLGFRFSVGFAGTTATGSFTNAVAAQIASGNKQITLTGADVTTNVKVGATVACDNATNLYVGRVVSIDTTKLFTVWPTPTFTDAAIAIGHLVTTPSTDNTQTGGACAASFQNRLLYGSTNDLASPSVTASVFDRRVYYSPLPTETSQGVALGAKVLSGAGFAYTGGWPSLNYFDVPGADPIVGIEPISGNQLLILTSTHPVVFSGNLVTQLSTTSPTITFDLSDINVNAGCLSDLTIQRTPRGIVWAGSGDIYAWDGRQPVSLTQGSISTYWRGLVRGSSFAVHGSAYVRGQYLVSGSSGGSTFALMCDLTGSTPKWTRASGAGTDLFFGVARPTDPSQVFANRFSTGASLTGGAVVRLDPMLASYVVGATTTDSDGSAVSTSITTRTITGDPETQKIFQRATVRHQQSSTTAAMTVTAQSKIDAADISAASVRTLGSLSNTSVLTVSSATNANPIVVTTSANHGLQTDDFVDIDGVTGNTNANGRWRISVTGNTTFSLVGGIGNGAFGGSPTCKKLTETDYLASTLNAGQGASVTIAGSPNNFELHGIRLGVFEKQPVMSA